MVQKEVEKGKNGVKIMRTEEESGDGERGLQEGEKRRGREVREIKSR